MLQLLTSSKLYNPQLLRYNLLFHYNCIISKRILKTIIRIEYKAQSHNFKNQS